MQYHVAIDYFIKSDKFIIMIMQTTTITPTLDSQQDRFTTVIQIVLLIVAVLSTIISLLFPILYFARRKCREHPSSLIAIISLLEALSNYNVMLIAADIYRFEHIVKVSEIFHLFVFYRPDQPTQTQFCEINFTIYIVLELMSIAYNIAFSTDLLITLKKPFFAGKKRMKFYHILCLLFVAIGLPMSITQTGEICDQEFHSRSIYKVPMAFLGSLVLFYLISFAIIIMSFRSIQTNQIRKKYIRLHRIILFTLIFLWAFPLATNILILTGDQSSNLFHAFNLTSFISLLLSGAIINIVRFYNDPYVWLQIKKMLKECKCSPPKKNQDQEEQKLVQENDIWNLPLANAVQTYHHQSVVSNIIEIVLETCTNTPEQLAIQRSQFYQSGQQQQYHVQSEILSLRDIKKMLRSGTKQDAKRLGKITKTQQMLCLEPKDMNKNDSEKNIYKTVNYMTVNSSQMKMNDSGGSNGKNGKKDDKVITIKVKSYADPLFVALRLLDNFNSEQLNKTLNLTFNAENIKKARQSLGASGSFFFFSYDHRLVIKTINEKQCKVFLKILPEYYEHILKNPNSLISRAYGLFSVQIAGISKIYFIMMENTLKNFEQNHVIYKKYDLKGSTIKREVKDVNADVFKDINLLKSDDAFMIMSQQRKKQLIQQIKSDIELLKNQNIMDYSLLLGVGWYKKIKKQNHQILQQQDLDQVENEWRCFDDGHEITGKIYTLSLIDYLQEYDLNKYMELKLKKLFKGGGDISSVDSSTYYNRFITFVTRIIVAYRK